MTKFDARNVTFASFHEASNRFATTDKTGKVQLWQLRTDQPEEIASYEQGVVSGLCRFSDDGERLIAVAEDGSVRAWLIGSHEALFSNAPVVR